jgi:hypothetical protein
MIVAKGELTQLRSVEESYILHPQPFNMRIILYIQKHRKVPSILETSHVLTAVVRLVLAVNK